MKFVIKGPLPGLNELIEAERRHRQEGARLKKQCVRKAARISRRRRYTQHGMEEVVAHDD